MVFSLTPQNRGKTPKSSVILQKDNEDCGSSLEDLSPCSVCAHISMSQSTLQTRMASFAVNQK